MIGGGMVGASIAYHCAGRGLKTALFERRHLANGGSGGNFGLVLWSTGQPSVRFALDREYDGAARVARLPQELDFDLEYRPAHGHCLLTTEEALALFSGHRDQFVAAGFHERIVTPAELRREEPNLYIGPEVIAALQTDEAVLNPFDLIPDSAREALRMFPQLGKLRIVRAWRSPAPFTPDHIPLVGRIGVYDNLLIASGFASAITQCPWASEFIADLAAGGSERFRSHALRAARRLEPQ